MMFLVLCVSVAALVWDRNRPLTLATCLIIPGLFKGLTASWCPLVLIKPAKWLTILWMAGWTLLLNGLILLLAGVGPYETWFRDILPNAQSMEIQRYWSHTMNLKGMAYNWGWASFPASLLNLFQAVGLLVVYVGYWKNRNAQGVAALANICAAIAAVLALFNMFNAVSWLPYITFLFPFAGWAFIEYRESAPPVKRSLAIAGSLLLLIVPALHLVVGRFILKTPQDPLVAGRDFCFGLEILFLILAYRRFYFAPPFRAG